MTYHHNLLDIWHQLGGPKLRKSGGSWQGRAFWRNGDNDTAISIRLDGKWKWHDFVRGDHGDVYDLVQKVLGCSLPEARKWLGEDVSGAATPSFRAPDAEELGRIKAQQDKERQIEYERVSKYVMRLWEQSPETDEHSYLFRKGINAHGIRIDEHGNLLVPMRDMEGRIWSAQRIDPEGHKRYIKGGKKEGMHYRIGEIRQDQPVLIAEGFATGATLHEATHLPVIVAFDAGNLLPVASSYRAAYPQHTIVIAGDNDHYSCDTSKRNTGKEKAEAAAQTVRGISLIPEFSAQDTGTDWNDYAQAHGLAAVEDAIMEGIAPSCTKREAETARLWAIGIVGDIEARLARMAPYDPGRRKWTEALRRVQSNSTAEVVELWRAHLQKEPKRARALVAQSQYWIDSCRRLLEAIGQQGTAGTKPGSFSNAA